MTQPIEDGFGTVSEPWAAMAPSNGKPSMELIPPNESELDGTDWLQLAAKSCENERQHDRMSRELLKILGWDAILPRSISSGRWR